MAIQAISQLKEWFRSGLYPTESQFADLIDSFRHKQDKIDMSDVEGLGTAINNKLPKSEFESLVKKVNGIVDNTDALRDIKQSVITLTESIADRDIERLLLMAGKYGGRTADGAVTLNGVTLSADDMVRVMALGYWEPTRKTNGLTVRTNLPPLDSGGYASPDMYAALVNSTIEVLNVRTQTADGLYVSALRYAFSGCQHLREIQGEIKVSGVTSFDRTFAGCSALEEVRLTGVAADVSLADSPLLSLSSILHLASNAKGESPITVTLHPTAYQRLVNDENYDNYYSVIFNKKITIGS